MKVEKTMNLVLYGEQNGYSAMAKTVGLPAALGTELIMKGEIQKTGVITPMSKEIYTPILGKLNENAIIFEDHVAAKQ